MPPANSRGTHQHATLRAHAQEREARRRKRREKTTRRLRQPAVWALMQRTLLPC